MLLCLTIKDLRDSLVAVDYADLPMLDLAEFDRPGGKEKLVEQLKNIVRESGNSVDVTSRTVSYLGFQYCLQA